jgi:hypothetical protein
MFVEVGAAAAKLAWENKATILETGKKIVALLSKGWVTIVVFGSGGVGKTTLGHLLSGNLDPENKNIDYIDSETTESFSLKAKVFGTILVGAGQDRRRTVSWTALFNRLSNGKVAGVINVVAWGCHSTSGLAEYKEHRVYKKWKTEHPADEISVEEFVKIFREDMLNEEIEALRFLEPHLKGAKGKVWMITVVAKQDLWWDRRHAVADHYTTGEYDKIIRGIRHHLGRGNFVHEYVSASFKWENLTTDKEILMPTVSGYDDTIQRANLSRLSQAIKQLVENVDA